MSSITRGLDKLVITAAAVMFGVGCFVLLAVYVAVSPTGRDEVRAINRIASPDKE